MTLSPDTMVAILVALGGIWTVAVLLSAGLRWFDAFGHLRRDR